jgi:hypothetical protein
MMQVHYVFQCRQGSTRGYRRFIQGDYILKEKGKNKNLVPVNTQNALNLLRDRVIRDITQKVNLA